MKADVLSLLRRAVLVAPSRIAVAYPGGQCSYTELQSRVSGLGASLPEPAHDGGGELIAVLAEHDPEVSELYLGIMARGHAVLPISARLPDEAVARIVARAGARRGILAPSAASRHRSLAAVADRTRWTVYGDNEKTRPLPERGKSMPAGTAMVCFTSGTTGEPKGVILTHQNLLIHGLTSALAFRMNDGDVHVNPMPLAHLAGASRVVSTLVNLNTHVILPRFEPTEVFDAIAKFKGTHLVGAPSMARSLLDAGPEGYDLSSLRILIVGTAPMTMPIVRELHARMHCGVFNGYGATESCALAVCLTPEQHARAVAENNELLLGSVGHPVPGIELELMDSDNREVPSGDIGQVALRGAKISPGYLDNPRETAAKFRPDGWLLTGDQGRLTKDGNLLLLGRIDEMIITGGLNVQPAEIECEAIRMEGVADCAAFAVQSERWGQEVRLAVVPAKGGALSTDALRAFLRSRLDPYKMPKQIYVLDCLPRTNVGKVQRFRLAEQCRLAGCGTAGALPE